MLAHYTHTTVHANLLKRVIRQMPFLCFVRYIHPRNSPQQFKLIRVLRAHQCYISIGWVFSLRSRGATLPAQICTPGTWMVPGDLRPRPLTTIPTSFAAQGAAHRHANTAACTAAASASSCMCCTHVVCVCCVCMYGASVHVCAFECA